MKGLKKIVCIITAAVTAFSAASVINVSKTYQAYAASYSSDYRTWDQGQSDYWNVRAYGCFITAQAKMLYEIGVNRTQMNPDFWYNWLCNNGCLQDPPNHIEMTNAGGAAAYAASQGYPMTYFGAWKADDDQLWFNINAGYYTICAVPNHFVLIDNEKSKSTGQLYVEDNGRIHLLHDFSAVYSGHVYRVDGRPSSSSSQSTDQMTWDGTVNDASQITETTVHLSATIPLQYITACGVYLGTSKNNMTEAGRDGSGRIKNIWYDLTGLKKGTVYYYKFYYQANGQTKWSEVKSFKTQGTVEQAKADPIKLSTTKVISNGDYYILAGVNTEYGLSIKSSSKKNYANVLLWKHKNNHKPMIFRFTYKGNGYYEIRNKNSGKCLDVQGGASSSGTNVDQYRRNWSDAQRWNIVSAGDGKYYLIPKCAKSMALDIYGGLITNGTNIQIWEQNCSDAQKFIISKV